MSPHRLFVDFERRPSNFSNSYANLRELPDGATQSVIGITASDGAASVGVLHRPKGRTKVCAVYMHARTNQTRPYLAPALLDANIAVWGQMSRYVNNDIDMTNEEVLLDLSAAMRMLREEGFETVIALGNSGGATLMSYYQSQASRPPAERQRLSPAGEPTGFDVEEMPPFDLYVALALHLGMGVALLRNLDPAVVDESDPVATDPELDMFDPHNGYREFPAPSQYDQEWIVRYRSAQLARARRLDSIALSQLADYHEARAQADPRSLTSATARRALYARIMIIHRTAANPAFLDPSIDPNRRPIGILGEHPIRVNFGFHGVARVMTPRAWLSAWSGLSSRSELRDTIQHVSVPSLIVYPDGDFACSPDDAAQILAACAAKDKTLETIEWATHYLTPAPGMPGDLAPPKVRAGALVVEWIKKQLN